MPGVSWKAWEIGNVNLVLLLDHISEQNRNFANQVVSEEASLFRIYPFHNNQW